jgi:hypothetical protein
MVNIIKTWIAKQLFKKGGAIATSKSVDFSTDALIKRLSKYNIKPDDITSEDQLLRVLSSVKQAEDNVFNNKFKGIMENNIFNKGSNQKPADVFDLKGNRIKNTDNIMGGEEIKIKDPALYEDRGGNIVPVQFSEAPAFPSYTAKETEEQILKRLKKQNEDSINRLKNKKDPEDPQKFYQGGQAQIEPDLSGIGHGSDALMARNMLIAPGSQATTSTGLNYLLGEDNDTTRVPYKDAGPVVLPKPKPKPNADPLIELQRIYDLYQESMPGVSQETQKYLQQDFIQKLNDAGISQEQFMTNQMQNNFANGGPARQNFKMGKRAFLKLIGGVGAGIAGIKTGLLGLGKKTVAKSVIAPAAQAANEAGIPPYFFKLVNKIKSLGDDATPKYANQPRETVTRYKDYELTEHLDTGQTTVRRFKQSEADYYDEPLMEEVYMSHRPGEMTEGAGGKFIKTADEYVEDTSFLRTSGGNKGEVMDTVDGLPDDLLEELGETIVKKAEGGRIGYKLGKKVIQEGIPSLIKKVNKLFNKEVVTTADKLPIPKKTLDRDMFNAANKRLNKKRQLTDTEIQDYEMELGDSETWMSEGTLGEAENALKNYKAYQDDMFRDYKAGKLDPVAGDKSPGRKKFLQQKFDEMEGSGDKRLMTRDEIEELSTFDLGTEMDQMKPKSIIPKNEYANYKNDFDKEILGMSEEDILMKKYPGMGKELAEQIANDPDPQRKAHVISMVEQTMEMGKRGMSGDEIIQMFKKGTDRTKQATGGLASILGE